MPDKIEKPFHEDPNYEEKGFQPYFPRRSAETIQQPPNVPLPTPPPSEPPQPIPPPSPEPPPPAQPPQVSQEP